jgi:hypothetical protein
MIAHVTVSVRPEQDREGSEAAVGKGQTGEGGKSVIRVVS